MGGDFQISIFRTEDVLGSEMMHAAPKESSWMFDLVLQLSGSASQESTSCV